MDRKIKNEAALKFIYLIRSNLPSNDIFYSIIIFVKFIGLILLTHNVHNYEDPKRITSISSILSKIYFFNVKFSIIKDNYQLNCLIIFLILISFILFNVYHYYRIKNQYLNVTDNESYIINKIYNNVYKKRRKKIFIYISYFYLFFIISSQHIFEYLIFGIIFPFFKENFDENVMNNFNMSQFDYLYNFLYSSQNFLNIYIVVFINVISYIILIIFNFSFFYINTNYFSKNGSALIPKLNLIFFNCFIYIVSSLSTFLNVFNEDKKKEIKFVICLVIVILLFIYIIFNIKNFDFYFKFPSILNVYLIFYCFTSGFIELFIYWICKENIIQKHSILKFLIEICSSFVLFKIHINHNENFFIKKFTKNLFNQTNEKFSLYEIYYYINILEKYLNNKEKYYFIIYEIIYNHHFDCTNKQCICNQLITVEFKKENIDFKILNEIPMEKEQFIIICEQEIVNKIHILHKKKKVDNLNEYCVLHCGFVHKIKKNLNLSLYLCGKYLDSLQKLSLNHQYFFYEMKKEILIELTKKINKISNKKKDYNIYSEEIIYLEKLENSNKIEMYLKLKKIFKFINLIKVLKRIMNDSLINLKNIFKFKNQLNSHKKIKNLSKNSFSKFLINCKNIMKNNEKIEILLKKYNYISNVELSYLLTNYYWILFEQIPEKLKKYFKKFLIYDKIKNLIKLDFKEFKMNYPLIISLNKKDFFEINYINLILTKKLEYFNENIIGNNFNILIPSTFAEYHNFLMKKFLFLNSPVFEKKSTFILNKENYLVNCDILAKLFPHLKNEFYIIIDIKINKNDINKNSNEINQSLIYSLILNYDFNILNISKNFEDNFYFNLKIFDNLKINYCDFFGIDEIKLKKILTSKMSKLNLFSYNLSTLIDENKAISIFTNIQENKIFEFRNLDFKKYFNQKFVTYKEKYKKKNLIKNFSKLANLMDELGFDIEWFNKLKILGERLNFNFTLPQKKKNKQMNSISNNLSFLYYYKKIGDINYIVLFIKENVNVQEYEKLINKLKIEIRKNISSETKNSLKKEIESNLNKKREVNFNDISEDEEKNYGSFEKKINEISFNNSKFDLVNSMNILNTPKKTQKIKIKKNETKNKENKNNESLLSLSNYELKKIIDKINFRYYYLQIFIYLIFIMIIIMLVFIIYYDINKMNIGINLITCSIYILYLKIDIYSLIMISVFSCKELVYDEKINELISGTIFLTSAELLEHYSEIMNYQKILSKYEVMRPFLEILYSEDNFYILQDDFKISIRNNILLEEINLLSFHFRHHFIEMYENDTCRLSSIFFNNKYLNENVYETHGKPTDLEKNFIYSIVNLFHSYKIKFEKLIDESLNILINFFFDFSNTLMLMDTINIGLSFFSLILIILILLLDKKEMGLLFLNIYLNDNKQLKFEENINLFFNCLYNYNDKNIENYEVSKLKNLDPSHFEDNLLKSNISTNIPTLINSNKSLKNNKKDENKNINDEDNDNDYHKKIFIPKTIITGLITSLILTILLLFLLWYDIYYLKNAKLDFSQSITLSINFLERIPKVIELILYSTYSVISGNTSVINNTNIDTYKDNKYLNFFDIKLNYENTTMIEKLRNSYYSNLLTENLLIFENIKSFLNIDETKFDELRNIKRAEESFNIKNQFLLYLSYEYTIYENRKNMTDDIYYFFFEINNYILLLKDYNSYLNEYGLETEFEYFYQELTNMMIDLNNKNITDEIKIQFFNNSDFIRMVEDCLFSFIFVSKSYGYKINEDLEFIFNKVKYKQLAYSLSTIIIVICLIIDFYILIFINLYYKKILNFFIKFYKKNTIYD